MPLTLLRVVPTPLETRAEADVAALIRIGRAGAGYQPSPDVRLVRDMWVRRGGNARVQAVKFMAEPEFKRRFPPVCGKKK